jgi:hypothetical protein
MSYPQIPFKMSEITIQPQARYCMQKLNLTVEDILTTINEWESGEVIATDPTTLMRLTEYPELENEIPQLYEYEKDFPERNVTVTVYYTTTIKKQQGKTNVHASVHWISTRLPLDFCPEDTAPTLPPVTTENTKAPADWLQPKKYTNRAQRPSPEEREKAVVDFFAAAPITLLLHKYQVKLLMLALTLLNPRNEEEENNTKILLELLEEVL